MIGGDTGLAGVDERSPRCSVRCLDRKQYTPVRLYCRSTQAVIFTVCCVRRRCRSAADARLRNSKTAGFACDKAFSYGLSC